MKRILIGAYILLAFISPKIAVAAEGSLVVAPQLGEYVVGESFSVSVLADTDGEVANAAEVTMQFDPALLEIAALSTGFSPLSLWSEEPTYSNETGRMSFSGWASEAFSGDHVELLKIMFRAKTSGIHTVTLTSGALLTQDGRTTNILTTLGAATYTVRPGVSEQVGAVLGATAVSESAVPHAPIIESIPDDAIAGDKLVVSGRAISGARVVIWVDDGSEDVLIGSVPASSDGAFVFVSETRLSAGSYEVWAEAYTADGVLSPASGRVQFTVPRGGTMLASAFLGIAEAPFLLFVGLMILGGVLGYALFLFLTRRSH